MLVQLVIQDVVLIDKLTLALEPGLNVFTGETGAGKSIVLDALGLALGARSDSALIRHGAKQASVTAEFSCRLSSALAALFEENGLAIEDPLLLRRVIASDGKSRAFVNDQPIGVTLLRQIGDELLEIHGQFESHGLLNPATHRGLLDAFAGHVELKQKTASAFAAWQKAASDYATAAATRQRAKAEEDFLRAAVVELDDLSPEEGETEKLAERRSGLQHREKILAALQTAEDSLTEERGAVSSLALAGKALARVTDKAPELNNILSIIDRAAHDVDEACQQIARFAHNIDCHPDALQRIEERLFALRAVARKHNVADEGLQGLHRDLKAKLALLTDQGDKLAALAKAAEAARHAYIKLAEDLSARRKKAAGDLMKRVGRELPPLKLERAQFAVEITPLTEDQWGEEGADRVAFLAATNPGTAPGPLQKVASGGELARFMLALKVVLAAADPVPVLVFDEVDAGIGGATASAVGKRLARLAGDVQILVVTHSPQVAARGAHHVRVLKQTKSKQAVTLAETLDSAARVEEIARMLAGTQTTDAARKAAVSLLNDGAPSTANKPMKRAAR
ncbi:MAG: DNA repair protein RecN [Alphaproteobacteria bacterium]|nr:DNA repair protein RecN [Alphaproteobacteria bacterium]